MALAFQRSLSVLRVVLLCLAAVGALIGCADLKTIGPAAEIEAATVDESLVELERRKAELKAEKKAATGTPDLKAGTEEIERLEVLEATTNAKLVARAIEVGGNVPAQIALQQSPVETSPLLFVEGNEEDGARHEDAETVAPALAYNVVFPGRNADVQVTQDENNGMRPAGPVTVSAQQEVTVEFSVKRRSLGSRVNKSSTIPNPWGDSDERDARLTVTLICEICRDPVQHKISLWRAMRQSSNVASFKFVPEAVGEGKLVFFLDKDGVRLDKVEIPLKIVDGDLNNELINIPISPEADPKLSALNDINKSKIDVRINTKMVNDVLEISIVPVSTRVMRASIRLTEDCHWPRDDSELKKFFRTDLTRTRLSARMRKGYYDITLTINKMKYGRSRNFLRAIYNSPTPIRENALGHLSDADAEKILKEFYDTGRLLYKLIFRGEGADAKELKCRWSIVEKVADHVAKAKEGEPLRIRIDSLDANYIPPWHWLHPGRNPKKQEANPDPREFWGMKYELSYALYNQEVLSDELKIPIGELEGLFGAWGDDSDRDVKWLGRHQWADLVESFIKEGRPDTNFSTSPGSPFDRIKFAESSAVFTDHLRTKAGKLNIIWTYVHGSSGSFSGEMFDPGPRVLFAKDDILPATEVDEYLSLEASDIDNTSLSEKPVVFLVGCETGTAGDRAGRDMTFQDVFLSHGAGAVIATDASVGQLFAYEFGRKIMKDLVEGKSLSRAILDRRIYFLQNRNNPMGLLFSYYGSPGARLSLTDL